jgi:hypothetical protein
VTTVRKPTAREAWEAIDEASFRAEVDRIVGMSDEELEAELLRDGFDPAELEGSEKTRREKATSEKARPEKTGPEKAITTAPTPIRRTRRTVLLAAAAMIVLAALMGGGVVFVASNWEHGDTRDTHPRPPESPADTLRRQGFDACDRHEWKLCLERLDEARELDPTGESDRRVQVARAAAEQALRP